MRPLIVGPERQRIRTLEERLDAGLGETVAEILPEAVTASRKKGDALAWAVEPLIEKSVREVVRRDPASFAEALSPTIGPAIRRAVAEALAVIIQRFNEALERSVSVQAIRWRIEARRTGRPFAEIVLLRTLVYRVEQLLLIHRDTGLVIQHLVAKDAPSQDPDQVSAMLSAIETFAHEAFHEESRLDRFKLGDMVGFVEHGSSALLVAIVRGHAPPDYELVLRDAVERLHLEHGRAFTAFRGGGPALFADPPAAMSDCLREQRKPPRRRWVAPVLIAAGLLAVLATVLGLWAAASRREQQRFASYADALRSEPGVVVTAADRRGGRYAFAGLRDPLASDPASVLARSGLEPAKATLEFEPFYSLDPRMVERRAAGVLRPPNGVTLSVRDGTLEARGFAPASWIERARAASTALPGVQAFDERRLHTEESLVAVRSAAETIERTELRFSTGSDRLPAAQRRRLDRVAAEAKRLLDLAPRIGLAARITSVGYSDPSGPAERNRQLSQSRAEHVVAELRARGVPGDALEARGAGVRTDAGCEPGGEACLPGEAARRARTALLRVDLRPADEG